MIYPKGTVLLAGWQEHIEDAKNYIKERGFTKDQVELLGTEDGQVIVRAKIAIEEPD